MLKTKLPKTPTNVREKPEYLEGMRAFERSDEHCPYIVGTKTLNGRTSRDHVAADKRISWWTGWLDGRRWKRVGHIYRKYGWRFPEE